MLISPIRTKLINAIVYFAANTRRCGKRKLFNLLYLLDFTHFRETGRSVTCLEYHAWRSGPVQLELMQEWDWPEPDMVAALAAPPDEVDGAHPQAAFDDSQFTRRELHLMGRLAHRFSENDALPLVGMTPAERNPWVRIWDNGRGNNARIPYSLAIPDNDPHRDAILGAAREYDAMSVAGSQPCRP
jgi:uncharacterized phage-associated protein